MRRIIELKLGQIRGRLDETIEFSDVSGRTGFEVARRCVEVKPARAMSITFLTGPAPEISRELLARMAEGLKLNRVHVSSARPVSNTH